jgi:ribose 5-phosphate isomerase B
MMRDNNMRFEDVGVTDERDDTMYPLVAERLVAEIIESGYSKEGILICGTGIGMAITANKFPGIYAAVCHDIYSAERAKLSNNANVITLGAKVVGPELAKRIVLEWLNLEFKPGSSSPKVEKIREFERKNFSI